MFYCIVCDDEITKSSVESHTDKFHPHICSICEQGVGDPLDMESHIESFHPGIHMEG